MQIVVNILITSGVIAMVAVGFALIYQTSRFFNLAHGIVLTSGAYFVLLFKVWLDLSIFLSSIIAIALSAVLGCLMEVSIYRPLRRRGASSIILLLASLGVYITLQNVISIIWGDETRTIRPEIVREGINILGARITHIQILIIFASILMISIVAILLKKTKTGMAIRAVSNDPTLANISGIKSDLMILWAFAIGSALAGIAGILTALDVDMTPTMGLNLLLMAIVAIIVGGVDNIIGIAIGALFLGMTQNIAVLKMGVQWQESIAFIILLIFFLVKPQGFLGKKLIK